MNQHGPEVDRVPSVVLAGCGVGRERDRDLHLHRPRKDPHLDTKVGQSVRELDVEVSHGPRVQADVRAFAGHGLDETVGHGSRR